MTEGDQFALGYYHRGRGNSKLYLVTEDDMQTMYEQYSDAQEIPLWCDGIGETTESNPNSSDACSSQNSSTEPAKKRPRKESTTQGSKRAAIQEEVDEIYEQLRDKHTNRFTPIQLKLWANMLHVGTHKDYDLPPDVPMFGGGKKKTEKRSEVIDALSGIAEGITRAIRSPVPATVAPVTSTSNPPTDVGISPGKQVHLRSQLIGQIKQLHELLEVGAITIEFQAQKLPVLDKLQKL